MYITVYACVCVCESVFTVCRSSTDAAVNLIACAPFLSLFLSCFLSADGSVILIKLNPASLSSFCSALCQKFHTQFAHLLQLALSPSLCQYNYQGCSTLKHLTAVSELFSTDFSFKCKCQMHAKTLRGRERAPSRHGMSKIDATFALH